MDTPNRRSREKQQRHEEILNAAESIFFSKGFANSSMDEIGKQAQLSRALLYVYFKDKAAIMRGIMLRADNCLEAYFHKAIELGGNGREQIERIGHAYYEFSKEQSHYFNVLTQLNTFPSDDSDHPQEKALSDCNARITQLMEDALIKGVRDGSLDSKNVDKPMRTAYFLQGALHGVIMAARTRHNHPTTRQDGEELVLYTIAMLTEAMRTRGGDLEPK